MVWSKYTVFLVVFFSIAAICCFADGQDVYRKSVYTESVSGDHIRIDLGTLYEGERFEITATPHPDLLERIYPCGYKIYKKEVGGEIRHDSKFNAQIKSFQINDISQPGDYELLLSTRSDTLLEIALILGYRDIVDFIIKLGNITPTYTLDWDVNVQKLVPVIKAKYWVDAAKIHINNSEFADAIGDLNYAIEINSSLAEAYNYRGLAHTGQGTLDSAIADFEKAVQIDPNCADAWYNYGFYLSEIGRLRESAFALDKAMSLNSYYRESHKETISEVFYEYSCGLIDYGQINEAVEVFNRSIEIDPDILTRHGRTIAETLYNKALILAGCDDYLNATLIIDRAIKIDSEIQEKNFIIISQIWYDLFKELERQGYYEAAHKALSRAIEINPPILPSHLDEVSGFYSSWGDELLDRGRYDDSEDAYSRCIAINSEKRPEIAERCRIRARDLNQRGQCLNATIVYYMAINVCPDIYTEISAELVQALCDLGDWYERSNLCTDSVDTFDSVLEIDPGNVRAVNKRAICQARINMGKCN